ncbi:HpcH/HpaI aldolase family protein [Auraticoccus monumenti]|uniref:4-hydroxy-2-oxoheptanedioate aldolase n=1 Tax=Auraticoccus monumenti TaxID=675864 RepID=A0A1G6T8V5_9ACTN|nr:aldolase/citrate lyase family protein [Auraticoccus monumenti]SDD24976.1 4-hydroxy-2-oxoheptanedioate aldolase [Auraticoccus monumenti]
MSGGGYDPVPTGEVSPAQSFATRLRARERVVGYWVTLDSPVATERLARLGYDYLVFDAQHGLLGYEGILRGLIAVDAAGRSAGVVRVGANDLYHVGRALDAGASTVIVPLVDDAEEAAAAVSHTRYAPLGGRSYGPMRSGLRIGPDPATAHEQVACVVMIETADGLANVEEICRVPNLAGVYIGPADLTLSLGGAHPADPSVAEEFEAALTRVREAAAAAGIAAGIHTDSGADAQRRLDEGFTFSTVSCDLVHLEQAALSHLDAIRR